jgi:hypothetical protein
MTNEQMDVLSLTIVFLMLALVIRIAFFLST